MSKLEELIQELCPNGVVYQQLGDVVDSLKKGTLKTTDLIEDGIYPVINSGKTFYGKYNDYNNDGNAITFASRGEYAGYVNYIDEKFWAGGLCYPYRTKANSNLDTKFLYYFLKEKEEYIRKVLVDDGSIPALNKSTIEKLNVPIPPLEVQSEIVRILDNFTLLTAELTAEFTAELTARRQQYDYYREVLLNNCEEFELVKLDDVASHFTGLTYKPSDISREGKGTLVLRSSNIQNSRLCFKDNVFVELNNIPDRAIARENDLLICVRNGSKALIGKSALIPKTVNQMAFGAFMTVLRTNPDKLYYRYLYHFWNSDENQKMIHGDEAMPINQITNKEFGKIVLKLPSLEKQKEIADILDKLDEYSNDLSQGLPAEIELRKQQYEYYRDKLLTFKELE